MDEVGCRPAETLVTAFMIVEVEVSSQAALGFMEVGIVAQVDLLVFHAAPHADVRDVGTPHLIGAVDRQFTQQIARLSHRVS